MLVSYNWLKNYVEIDDLTVEELSEKLTRGGVEVDAIHPRGEKISHLVVGLVEKVTPHPNADKLRVCQVNIGETVSQIVCGAPNVAEGQKVVVAKPGAVLPGDVQIKATTIRGETSEGMICSLDELGIEQKLISKEWQDGIYVLPEEIEVGTDAAKVLGLDDTVLELDLTPNRADCLSMIGVAYEVAALLGREVRLPERTFTETNEKTSDYIRVEIQQKEDNPFYYARVIKNVTIGPSPQWMQNYLTAAGIRPINNVVDITNFVLMEYGQPLHAFDYDRFGSKEVVVRRAHDEEKITTLDGEERVLSPEHLAITNGKEPVALAGVMGGAFSEVQEDTTTVLLEAAYFSPIRVRRASHAFGLRSEASQRYEKGIDPFRVEEAAERALSLLEKYAGGEVLQGVVARDYRVQEKRTVTSTTDRLNQILGTNIATSEILSIFERLRFEVTEEDEAFTIHVPTRRLDISIEEDIAEEVARLYGYNKIPTTLPISKTTPGALTAEQKARRQVRRYLEASGFSEALTYSLTSPEKTTRFLLEEVPETVRLSMPMSEERSVLRTSLIPHLLDAIQHNLNRQVRDVALFEIGDIFIAQKEKENDLPTEKMLLGLAMTGTWESHRWQGEEKKVDFYVIKGVLEGLFASLGISEEVTYSPSERPDMHPGRSADIHWNGEFIGIVGQIHPLTAKEWDVKETYVAQIYLGHLLEKEKEVRLYEPLPRYPSITRDIALVVDKDISAGDVKAVIASAGGELLKQITLFDVYEGEHLEEGKKSLAFSLVYLDPNRTLTDEEVTTVHESVLQELETKLHATLRDK